MAIRGIAKGLKKGLKGRKPLSAVEKKARELKRAKTKTPATYESEVKKVRQMTLTDEMRKSKLAKLAAKYGKPKPKTAMTGGPRPAPKKKPMAKEPPAVALSMGKGGPDKVRALYAVQATIREKAKKAGMSVKRFRQLNPNDPSVKKLYTLNKTIKYEDDVRKFKQAKKKK
jgi:hypothetical protein